MREYGGQNDAAVLAHYLASIADSIDYRWVKATPVYSHPRSTGPKKTILISRKNVGIFNYLTKIIDPRAVERHLAPVGGVSCEFADRTQAPHTVLWCPNEGLSEIT